jgi:hypothetical protein
MQISEQISDISAKLEPVLNDMLFTTDKSKAVAVIKDPVGQEEFNRHDTYKYNVEMQSTQSADFVKALKEALKDTPLEDFIEKSMSSTDNDSLDIDKLVPDSGATTVTYSIEVWVDMDLRFFRNVRVTPVDKDGKTRGYIEFGLDYDGGDSMPFSLGVKMTPSKDSADNINAVLRTSINKSTKAIDFGFDVSGAVGGQNIAANGKMSVKPSNDQVQVEKPENAKSIMELIMQIAGGDSSGAGLEQELLDSFGGDTSLLNAVEL